MILTSHQPNFLPYMGFFYKAAKSDVLVLSEDVMFSKKGMHNWNRIYTDAGVKKLTLPVSAHHDTPLCEAKLSEPVYNVGKMAKTLEREYRNAENYASGMDVVDLMLELSKKQIGMTEFNETVIKFLLRAFCISAETVSSVQLGISGHKDERIFQMCERLGADIYLSGTGARAYHQDDEYVKRGIKLVYSDYEPLRYNQVHGNFVENLSVIDYVFNEGYKLPEAWI